MRVRFLLLALVLLAASCFNEDDYNIQRVTLNPTMAIPIAFGNLGLVDMMANNDTAYVRSYPDGLLYLYYPKTLPSTSIRDMFTLPDDNTTTSFSLPGGTLPASAVSTSLGYIDQQIDLGLSPEELSEILMKSGKLEHFLGTSNVTSPPNLPLEATVTILDVTHKTTNEPLVFTIGNGTDSLSIADYVFHLNGNIFTARVDMVIKPHPATFIPAATTADVRLGFKRMKFAYIKGFLGDQVTPMPPQTVDISVFSSTLKDASVNFVQPSITLQAVNDYGVPTEVSFSVLRAKKGGSTLPIQISPSSPVTLNFPSTLGTSSTTDITITNQQAILNFEPEQLEYTTSARINKNLGSGDNFLADTSKLRISLITEIPLYGRITGITVIDTLDIDLSDIKETNILDASLKITAQNEMPLDAKLQIYLLDENYTVMDSLFTENQTNVVKASTVDAAGDLAHTGVTDLQFGLSTERLSKLFISRFLLVRAVMSTARDEDNVLLNVKFRSNYRLNLNFGLLAKVNLELK